MPASERRQQRFVGTDRPPRCRRSGAAGERRNDCNESNRSASPRQSVDGQERDGRDREGPRESSAAETGCRAEADPTRSREQESHLDGDEVAQLLELLRADPGHFEQILDRAEAAVTFSEVENALGERRPDAGQ